MVLVHYPLDRCSRCQLEDIVVEAPRPTEPGPRAMCARCGAPLVDPFVGDGKTY